METKSKILYLYRFLNEMTDENNPVSTTQIISYLNTFGISVARKTVASDIALLCEFGVDIITVRSSQNMYYIGKREFELPEVKLLVDAVESSKFITHKKSKQLISKLSKLVSCSHADELNRYVFVDKRVKPDNEEIYYSIDKIHEAIKNKKQIEFKYKDYNQDKEITYKHNGLVYNLSPYALAWNDDHYYVIGFCSNHNGISKFRVDRIARAAVMEKDALLQPEGFVVAEYVKSIFDMYDGEMQKVELKCTNDLMRVIIDKFGEDVETYPLGSNCFKAIIDISISPTFYGWVFGFGNKMSILAPSNIAEEYKKMLVKQLEDL